MSIIKASSPWNIFPEKINNPLRKMKNKNIIQNIAALLLSGSLFVSCGNKIETPQKQTTSIQEKTTVELSEEQYQVAKVSVGTIEMKDLSGAIKVNGMLDVPPQNL